MALSSSVIFVLDYQKKHAQGLLMDKGSFKNKNKTKLKKKEIILALI